MKNIVRINIDNKMNDLKLNIENKNTVNILNKNSNRKGKNNIRHLYSWTQNTKTIKCYGWYDGEHDCVNKHELIPNGSSKFLDEESSTILLYGDIFLLLYDNNNKVSDFSVSDYAEFYEEINEGFDDCDSDEYDSDDDDTEDTYGNNDEEDEYEDEDEEYNGDEINNIENDFEIINTSDSEELDTDNNNY
jgi:hypothetical protein